MGFAQLPAYFYPQSEAAPSSLEPAAMVITDSELTPTSTTTHQGIVEVYFH